MATSIFFKRQDMFTEQDKKNLLSKNKAIVRTILRHDPDLGTIRDFKITMINMLTDSMEKVENPPEQLGSFSKDRETTQWKYQI